MTTPLNSFVSLLLADFEEPDTIQVDLIQDNATTHDLGNKEQEVQTAPIFHGLLTDPASRWESISTPRRTVMRRSQLRLPLPKTAAV